MPYHKLLDSISESGENKIGTTGRGIGPCYIDKYARKGIKIVDLLNRKALEEKIEKILKEKNNLLKKVYDHEELDVEAIIKEYHEFDKTIDKYIKDVPTYLNGAINEGSRFCWKEHRVLYSMLITELILMLLHQAQLPAALVPAPEFHQQNYRCYWNCKGVYNKSRKRSLPNGITG